MIYCHVNGFASRPRRLGKGYFHSKKQSYGKKTSNLTFFSVK